MSTNTTTNGTPDPWQAKELGVLWKRIKQGTKEAYLTGTINLKALGFDQDVPVIIFTNKRKQKETHPDLRIYISEKRVAATTTTPAAPATATTAPRKAPAAKTAPAPAPAATAQAPDNDLI